MHVFLAKAVPKCMFIEGFCEELEIVSTHGEVDYLKTLRSMIETSTTRGVVYQEIERKKENKLIVQNALNSLYGYIARSKQNIDKSA